MCTTKWLRLTSFLAVLVVLLGCTGCAWGHALNFIFGGFGDSGDLLDFLPNTCPIPDASGGVTWMPC